MLGGVGRYLRSSPMLRVNARAQDQMPIHSGRRPLPLPSPLYSRISCPPPTDGPPRTPAQQVVRRLHYRRQSNAPHHLAPVTTRSIPHQRFYSLESLNGRLATSTAVSPSERLPPQTRSIHQLHSLTHLHSTTTPYPPNRPPQTHSHLIGKAKNRLRTHPRSGKGSTQAPTRSESGTCFFHTLCTSRSAFS